MPTLPSTFGLHAANTEPQRTLHLQIGSSSRTRLPQIATVVHHSGLNMPQKVYSPGMRGSLIQAGQRGGALRGGAKSPAALAAQAARDGQFRQSAFEDNNLSFSI